MNIRSLVVLTIAALCASGVLAETAPRKGPPNRVRKPSGGIVFSPAQGKHLCIVNAQDCVPRAALEKGAFAVKAQLLAPLEFVEDRGPGTVAEKIARACADPKVAAAIAIVADESSDSILYYPDRGYAVVNAKTLTRDGVSADRIEERAVKQVWRAFGLVLGAGEAIGGYSILQRAQTLEELDAIKAKSPSPEQHNRMVDSINRLGVKMVKAASYRTACQQGWAPAPTNDEQKKIWDEVHALPKTPMKIEFDPKKGK